MTPKEKAQYLKVQFFILPEENIGVAKMTGEEMSRLAKQCALIAVQEIINSKPSVDFWDSSTGMERRSKEHYWYQVKEEIEIM